MKEFVCAVGYWPLLPDGTYIAQCIGYDIHESYGGRSRKIYLHVTIIQDPYEKNKVMSPKIFKNKIFKIRTRQVKRKFRNGKDMPPDCDYSIVDTIEEVLAG